MARRRAARRRRRDEIHDRQAHVASDRLERGAFIGREIRHDDAGRAGIGEPGGGLAPIATADDLVRVAHGHERDTGARFGNPLHELDRAVERRTGPQRRR